MCCSSSWLATITSSGSVRDSSFNRDFHFGRPGRYRYTPSDLPRGPDGFVAVWSKYSNASGSAVCIFPKPVPSIYSSASPWVGSQPCGAQYPGLRCPPYFASLLPRRTPLRILNGTIRRVSRNVKRWKSPFHGSPMDRSWRRHRQKKFRRIKGYRHMGALVHALRSKHKLLICGLLQKGRVLAQDGMPTIIMMKDTQPIHRWVLPQSSVGGRPVTCSRARVLA